MSNPIQTAMLIDDDEIDQRIYGHVMQQSGPVQNVLTITLAQEDLAISKPTVKWKSMSSFSSTSINPAWMASSCFKQPRKTWA